MCNDSSLLTLHADIVEIKHIMLPPSPRQFKDIYVVFELMETDLHQVCHACMLSSIFEDDSEKLCYIHVDHIMLCHPRLHV